MRWAETCLFSLCDIQVGMHSYSCESESISAEAGIQQRRGSVKITCRASGDSPQPGFAEYQQAWKPRAWTKRLSYLLITGTKPSWRRGWLLRETPPRVDGIATTTGGLASCWEISNNFQFCPSTLSFGDIAKVHTQLVLVSRSERLRILGCNQRGPCACLSRKQSNRYVLHQNHRRISQ